MAARRTQQLKPLLVTARLAEGAVIRKSLMLDALLSYAVAIQEQHVVPMAGEPMRRFDIPIALEPGGRFYLCSSAQLAIDGHELRYKSRQAPWHEFARLGTPKIRRVDIASGVNKSYRVPYEMTHVEGGEIHWWCLGDADRIIELLGHIRYVGRLRGSGKGRLRIHGEPWRVGPCETWDGFPVLRDGKPLRPLPQDYPGITECRMGVHVLSPPYWDNSREELCALPG